MKEKEKIVTQLDSKERRIKKEMERLKVLSPSSRRLERIENAENFLSELSEVRIILGEDVQLVTKKALTKLSNKADCASVEFDGEFCKLILVQTYPYRDAWLLYVAPVESI